MLPTKEQAEELLREAEKCNPGPWGNHSRVAAHCAQKIAGAIEGMDRLTIRRFHRSDSDNLYKLISDKEVMRFLEPPYSREKSEAFLHTAGLSDNPLIYAVDDKEGNFIGYVIYHVYEEKSYEIGWVLYKQEWNKGYAQELTKLLIDDAKKKNRNLIIECLPEQVATKKIALSNGFEYCGNIDQCDVYLLKMD